MTKGKSIWALTSLSAFTKFTDRGTEVEVRQCLGVTGQSPREREKWGERERGVKTREWLRGTERGVTEKEIGGPVATANLSKSAKCTLIFSLGDAYQYFSI